VIEISQNKSKTIQMLFPGKYEVFIKDPQGNIEKKNDICQVVVCSRKKPGAGADMEFYGKA
jgi:hypothetical protein